VVEDPATKAWLADIPQVPGATWSSLDPRLLHAPRGIIVGGVVVTDSHQEDVQWDQVPQNLGREGPMSTFPSTTVTW
jgi:hypothetical protein